MKHKNAMMDTATRWAKESYCKRRQVAAVVAMGRDILSIGINGTISGLPNECEVLEPFKDVNEMQDYNKHFVVECCECDGSGQKWHMHVRMECDRCGSIGHLKDTNVTSDFTLHAEPNAILRAAKGHDLTGASIYITLAPCKQCAKLIASHKFAEVFYRDSYKDMSGVEFLESCGIKVEQLNP